MSQELGIKEFQEQLRAGSLLTRNINVGDRTRFLQQTFLLAPGGQEYVGDNSYDLSDSNESEVPQRLDRI